VVVPNTYTGDTNKIIGVKNLDFLSIFIILFLLQCIICAVDDSELIKVYIITCRGCCVSCKTSPGLDDWIC
jgi:hypothetical protein